MGGTRFHSGDGEPIAAGESGDSFVKQRRSKTPMLAVGSLLYVAATTGFGEFVSTFTRTQVSAVFATAILSIIPSVNFSGLLVPVASLSGGGRLFGLGFPPAWYQPISVGAFTKGLGFEQFWPKLIALAGFFLLYLVAAQLILCKQEK